MQLMDFFAKVKMLNQPVFQTRDVVALLDYSTTAASKALSRLTIHGHLLRLKPGLWALPDKIAPLMLPQYLTAPFPSYISLQSALYYHGMIEQIPEIIYAVSLARTKKIVTPIATVSIHHVAEQFYFGYTEIIEKDSKNTIRIATPEKTLLDFLYLSPGKTRWFASLPELEFPKTFDHKLFKKWLNKIPYARRKTVVANKYALLLQTNG
jgi:predicted transcriptional regulator of viral defense system